jgi:hypothetical protein
LKLCIHHAKIANGSRTLQGVRELNFDTDGVPE